MLRRVGREKGCWQTSPVNWEGKGLMGWGRRGFIAERECVVQYYTSEARILVFQPSVVRRWWDRVEVAQKGRNLAIPDYF